MKLLLAFSFMDRPLALIAAQTLWNGRERGLYDGEGRQQRLPERHVLDYAPRPGSLSNGPSRGRAARSGVLQ